MTSPSPAAASVSVPPYVLHKLQAAYDLYKDHERGFEAVLEAAEMKATKADIENSKKTAADANPNEVMKEEARRELWLYVRQVPSHSV